MGYQERKYRLLNIETGAEIILDGTGTKYIPRNWKESNYTIKISTSNFSTEKKTSDSLEFTGSGASFLRDIDKARGVEAKVLFQEYRSNPKTNEFESYDISLFDFSEFIDEITVVKIQLNSGDLASLVKSKQSNKYELERTTSINGKDIGEFTKNKFSVINRPIYLDSKAETSEEDKNTDPLAIISITTVNNSLSFPTTVIYESDDNFVSSIPNQVSENANIGLNAGLFYTKNDIDKTLSISFEASYIFNIVKALQIDIISLDLVVYNGGDALNLKERININKFENVAGENISSQETASYVNENFTLLKDESLAIQWNFYNVGSITEIQVAFTEITSVLQVTEYSLRTDLSRQANFVLNKDVGEREMQIITGEEGRYYSSFFNDGEFKYSGITTGKQIRGFKDSEITLSLKDWLKNCFCLWGMGYNIEVINGKEVLVHEKLREYFFRPEIVIRITEQVKVTSRSVAREFIYNTVKTGYKKPSGDNLYEEVNGLNEYNTTNEYITPITKVVEDYDIESPFRADSEGKELTVRKNIKTFPTEDYRTDKNIFNLDLKDIGTGVFEERTWRDDFEEAPKNIFNADTATGLRITPLSNMFRHSWLLNSAYTKERNNYIRYASTRGNSELITKKVGEDEKKENGDFKINTLENPIFVSKWIEFEFPLDFDMLKLINGKTNINGRYIPNTYFKIEFINEKNEKETGYLFELKPNGVGKWKLLKAL